MNVFEIFNNISAELEIDFCSGKIKEVSLNIKGYYDKNFKLQKLPAGFGSKTLIESENITLIGEAGIPVTHASHSLFRVSDVIKAIELTELETRSKTDWLGGVDLHHICFEGITRVSKNTYKIQWGS